jgi:diketogulonate reductase-like aldo/keto reductase
MQYKTLGSNKRKIPVIGQGCMGVGGYFDRDTTRDDFFIRMLQEGIDSGLTFLDTAEAYGGGHSEKLVGIAIAGKRNEIFLATKVSPEHLSRDGVLRSAERSLRRLKTDHIDLYQVHWPNPKVPIEETMGAMEQLVRKGMIGHIGVSNFSLRQLKQAQAALSQEKIVSIQNEYNLFDRTVEKELLPYCQQEGITMIAYSPLDKGSLVNKDIRNKTLQEIANRYNKTASEVALKWLVDRPPVVAIPKATNVKHIKNNASSADFELLPEDAEKINRLFALCCVYLPTDRIRVDRIGFEHFIPSPKDLAETIRQGESIKPIRVIRTNGNGSDYEYDLVEGKLRYWAWEIAYEGKEPIPALIREES